MVRYNSKITMKSLIQNSRQDLDIILPTFPVTAKDKSQHLDPPSHLSPFTRSPNPSYIPTGSSSVFRNALTPQRYQVALQTIPLYFYRVGQKFFDVEKIK